MIVGSRLQALSLVAIAAAIAIAFSDQLVPFAGPVAGLLVIAAATIAVRRLELGSAQIRYRRALLGTVEVDRCDVDADLGHRYLALRFSGEAAEIRPGRIEVPVEIRPNVRDWAAKDGAEGHG